MQKIHPQETETQQAKKGDRMESSREGSLEISFFFFFPACCMCMDKGETGVLLPLNPKGRLVLGESSIWLQNPSSSVIAKLGKPTLYYFVALQCSVRNMSRGSGKIQNPQLCRERRSYSPWGPLHTFIQTDSEPYPTALRPGGQPSAASLHVCMLSHVRLFASQVAQR